MGVGSSSIVLVSREGEEVQVEPEVLRAASVPWRERYLLAGGRLTTQSSAEEIHCFVKVISLIADEKSGKDEPVPLRHSDSLGHDDDAVPIPQPSSRSGSLGEEELAVAVMSGHDLGAISPRPNAVSEDDIDIGVMWHALPLLHKYDCAAARQVLERRLERKAFPSAGFATCPMGSGYLANAKRIENWLTQEHLEYIVRKQELFGAQSLAESMKKVLVGLFFYERIYANNLSTFIHVDKQLAPPAEAARGAALAEQQPIPTQTLRLPAWRLTPETLIALVPLARPAF